MPAPINPTAAALNRVADALFQQAKSHARQVKVAERQVALQEQLLQMQAANLAVTRHLEQVLANKTMLEMHPPVFADKTSPEGRGR